MAITDCVFHACKVVSRPSAPISAIVLATLSNTFWDEISGIPDT